MLFKACQYAAIDDKVSMGLSQVSVKGAQTCLQKTLLGQKNLGRGGENGKQHVLKVGCHFLSKRHVSKPILQAKSLCLKNVLTSKKTILLFYGKQKMVTLQQ